MKSLVLLFALAALMMSAVTAAATDLSSTGLRGEGRSLGRNNRFRCPSNSRKTRRNPRDFRDCRCRHGFVARNDACFKELYLKVKNLSYLQPLSPFFVAVHNDQAPALYKFGEPSTNGLRVLAEDGNPAPLISEFQGEDGVAETFSSMAPIFPGATGSIKVYVNDDYPYVSIASMAINTNDCFVALNGVKVYEGLSLLEPGLDAGTEANNELCTHIPGPACPPGSGNLPTDGGEGFVHVHRGFQSINIGRDGLSENELGANGQPLGPGYDWRNPMMQVYVDDQD